MLSSLQAAWKSANKTLNEHALLWIFWFLSWNLISDRVFGWANRAIDSRATGMTPKLVSLILWFNSPLVLFGVIAVLTVCGIVTHAYIKAQNGAAELPKGTSGGLTIHSAIYGADGKYLNGAAFLQNHVLNGVLDIVVDNDLFKGHPDFPNGDPIQGVPKHILIAYSFGNSRIKFVAQRERQPLMISQTLNRGADDSFVVDIFQANKDIRRLNDAYFAYESQLLHKNDEIAALKSETGVLNMRLLELTSQVPSESDKFLSKAQEAQIKTLTSLSQGYKDQLHEAEGEIKEKDLTIRDLRVAFGRSRIYRCALSSTRLNPTVEIKFVQTDDADLAQRIHSLFYEIEDASYWKMSEKEGIPWKKNPTSAARIVFFSDGDSFGGVAYTINDFELLPERVATYQRQPDMQADLTVIIFREKGRG